MRVFLTILLGVFAMWPFSQASALQAHSVYEYSFPALVGDGEVKLADYKGKVLLIVNTASKCGFTGQYEGLQKLYDSYKDQGLVVIGVPSNDFGAQEPGSEKEIAGFCQKNYGVTFPMTAKQIVTGDDAHPFYYFARESLGYLAAPKWNFHKYLIGRDGMLVDYYHSTTAPDSERLVGAITEQLAKPAP